MTLLRQMSTESHGVVIFIFRKIKVGNVFMLCNFGLGESELGQFNMI